MRSRSLHVFAILAFLSAFSFTAPGCSRPKDAKVEAKNGKDIKLTFLSNNAEQFWVFAQRGAEKYGKDAGIECIVKMPPQGTSEEQKQIIQDLLVKGIQGLAISPNDAANMGDFLAGVNKKIPVLVVDSDTPDPSNRRGYLGTDNYLAGRALGELVKKAAPDGGKVAFFVGRMDAINAVERRQGAIDVLAGLDRKVIGEKTPPDATNLKIGNYTLLTTLTDGVDSTKSQSQCEDLLTKTPDVDVLIGLWEYNPPALLRAVNKATDEVKKHVKIVAFDENDSTLQGIADGKIVGTIVQDPYEFGYQSMKILHGLAKGEEDALKKAPGIDEKSRIYVPYRVITPENVGPFRAKCKELLGK